LTKGAIGHDSINEYGIDDTHNHMKPTENNNNNNSFDPRNRDIKGDRNGDRDGTGRSSPKISKYQQ
jgi:hypothetical protein